MSTRKHELKLSLNTTPEKLWRELTEGDRIIRWFAPEAKVKPGVGGSVWVSWGPGMEGEQSIEVWEPGKRMTLRMGPQTVDYIIEADGDSTTLRLVHDGFSTDAAFDGEYESTLGGWQTFFAMLRNDVERHYDEPAVNFTLFRMSKVRAAEAFAAVTAAPEFAGARPVGEHRPGYGGYEFATLNNSFLSVFCEGKGNAMVTTTWILYGLTTEQQEELKTRWTSHIDALFPA